MVKIQLLKGSFCLFLVFSFVYAKSQSYVNPNKIQINYKDSSIVFAFTKDEVKNVKKNTVYYWYKEEALHRSEFGYSGYLLDGLYIAYYKGGDIKTKGTFKNGVKVGLWKYWNKDGDISTVVNFDKSLFKKIFRNKNRGNNVIKTIDANETE